jgi:hypothetical protein
LTLRGPRGIHYFDYDRSGHLVRLLLMHCGESACIRPIFYECESGAIGLHVNKRIEK